MLRKRAFSRSRMGRDVREARRVRCRLHYGIFNQPRVYQDITCRELRGVRVFPFTHRASASQRCPPRSGYEGSPCFLLVPERFSDPLGIYPGGQQEKRVQPGLPCGNSFPQHHTLESLSSHRFAMLPVFVTNLPHAAESIHGFLFCGVAYLPIHSKDHTVVITQALHFIAFGAVPAKNVHVTSTRGWVAAHRTENQTIKPIRSRRPKHVVPRAAQTSPGAGAPLGGRGLSSRPRLLLSVRAG